MDRSLSAWKKLVPALICGLGASLAFAADPIGYVKTVSGDARVISGSGSVPARPGTPLAAGDQVQTGPGASCGVTLRDNTQMAFGPSTRFTFEEYLFAPAKGDLRLAGRIGAGTLHYVSGSIAQLRPQAVELKTPNGIIGIRGTTLAVLVEP